MRLFEGEHKGSSPGAPAPPAAELSGATHSASDVLNAYEAMVASEGFSRDSAQVGIACALDDVLDDLRAHQERGRRRFFRRKLGRAASVRGLYIWGAVGRGKTMLMDLFFEAVPLAKKRRQHFNEFMRDAHAKIERLRKTDTADPVTAAADEIAQEAQLLCFDEFAVTDIADAMILSRLFNQLFQKGVTLVATSNVAPQNLYEKGLNRKLFEPFIKTLLDNVQVAKLDADTDYRLNRLEGHQVWFQLGDPGFDRTWMAAVADRSVRSVTVPVGSREIAAPRAAGGLARFTFQDLCDAPLGASDFLAIANRFHTLFLEAVPVMSGAEREIARRFINLIDVLYDQSVRLVVSAEAEPADLFDGSAGNARQESFAFARTASRLYEMRSASYLHGIETTPYG
ncbi:MAG: cell division protein ZapE [Pseudomonadota bacterium]